MLGKALSIVCVAVLLTGCSVTSLQKSTNHRLMHSLYDYGAANKHLLVTPIGTMFGDVSGQGLINALPTPIFKQPTTYTLDKAVAEHPKYRLVLGINSPLNQGRSSACKGELTGGEVTPGTPLTILSVFCYDQKPLSSAKGGREAVSGWDDPALSGLLSNIIHATFPREREIDRCPVNAAC